MKPKIIFIINTLPNQRCIKRIEEFIENGYQIAAFTFVRSNLSYKLPEKFKVEVIGIINAKEPYYKRMKTLFRGIKNVKTTFENSNIVYYYFGLDIAMIGALFSRRSYFYEISDLSQTYLSNPLKTVLNKIDKRIINKSLRTIVTSEGFIKYHFGNNPPKNILGIPNRLNKRCLDFSAVESTQLDTNRIKIGFVGFIRYASVINFASVFAKNFPNGEFHFYGSQIEEIELISELEKLDNVYFHGEFSNPEDLPEIYSNINLVLSTYDIKIPNVKYAEPNKLYESIFFNTPIIVSGKTFLSDKVQDLGVGYSIDAMNDLEVVNFINDLDKKDIEKKINHCKKIPSSFSIDDNKVFFTDLENIVS